MLYSHSEIILRILCLMSLYAQGHNVHHLRFCVAGFFRFYWQGLCLGSEGSVASLNDFWMSHYFVALGINISYLLPQISVYSPEK